MGLEEGIGAGGKGEPTGFDIAEDGSATPSIKKGDGPHFEDVGGLNEQISTLMELLCMPVQYDKLFDKIDLERAPGILIYGPLGSGKTLLVTAIKNELEESSNARNLLYVNSNAIYSPNPEVMVERLGGYFLDAAAGGKNSVLVLDNLDLIAPDTGGGLVGRGRSEGIITAAMTDLMSKTKTVYGGLIVIGVTSNIDRLSKDLIGDGRFEAEIEIPIPDKKARTEIIDILMKNKPRSKNFDVDAIAELTQGYTGADLHALLKEASLIAVKSAIRRGKEHLTREGEDVRLTQANVLSALKKVKPSMLKEAMENVPNVKWSDVGGLEKVKEEILEAVELPLTDPEAFKAFGIRPVKGIMLYGPPGTGKTLLAKAVANRCHANFISVNVTELFNKYVGESEAMMREYFKEARRLAPCILFFDEFDAIGGIRDGSTNDGGVREKILDAFMIELDGFHDSEGIIVMAATNRPDLLDPASIRSGRFDKVIEVSMPGEVERLGIFKVYALKMPLGEDVDLQTLAKLTEKYNGADIENLCREAGVIAMRKKKAERSVSMGDFMEALKEVRPSLNNNQLQLYNLARNKDNKSELGFRRPEHVAMRRTTVI
ncbi:MAG: AAA family ATPase [Candidatus Micrarchaeaceae archaeon]